MKKEKTKRELQKDTLKQVSGGKKRRPSTPPPAKDERPDRGTVGPLIRADE
ncbi:Uncharacterised protein [Legionella hackeliae]|uniref:Uncharacterized protein n=2 Tax=Legionella hackeliae TaxID=449 RepID=A0A0A8UX32_LEGHA|nr:hypothetical protein Lhac_0156 [Legionella hackeliae]CEK11319.1 protein of unknown function [Legionella hackeliae]STX48089.1 Uncharacterised protein [Legionella hackeliae]